MKDFAIITDSGCDLSQDMIESLEIGVVPMGITIGDKAYKHFHDFRELGKEAFYEKIRSGQIGTTSGVNIQDAFDKMREKLERGLDILYLSFSSGMSCSYQSAVTAADELRNEYPDSKIKVVDTLAGSVGLGMLAYIAAKKKIAGEKLVEIVEWLEQHRKNICHYFMVDDLRYIQKTGRVTNLTAFVGTALGIKPVFKLDENGKVISDGKVRGKKSGIKHLINRVKEKCVDSKTFFICHADAECEAKELEGQIKLIHPESDVIVNCVGPILGNNVGPGALAVIFYGDLR